jgi:hypothetical protein
MTNAPTGLTLASFFSSAMTCGNVDPRYTNEIKECVNPVLEKGFRIRLDGEVVTCTIGSIEDRAVTIAWIISNGWHQIVT